LAEFITDDRGKVLVRRGAERQYRFRFRDPMMQPYLIIRRLREEMIPPSSPADYPIFEEERRSLSAGFPHAWLNRQSSDFRHSPWRGNAYVGAVRVAQEEAVNTTKQQRTHQSAVELDELGWRWALKLADLDRREYYHKQPAQTSHAPPSALLNAPVRPTLH
jgi:hypothetical protein